MSQPANIDLLTSFRQLLAINKSQESRMGEYEQIISSRNQEIAMLQSMLSEASAFRSAADNQLKELNDVQAYLNNLSSTVAMSSFAGNPQTQLSEPAIDAKHHQQLVQSHSMLQSSVDLLKSRVAELESQLEIMDQQQERIRELEHMLFIAEDREEGKRTNNKVQIQ